MSNAIQIDSEKQIQLNENLYKFPGIYDISENEYHGGAGISRSSLLEFTNLDGRCPYKYWYKKVNGTIQEEKKHFLFGHALHTFFLEPEEFEKRFLVIPKMRKNTNQYKDYIEKITPELNNRKIIDDEQYKSIQGMNKRINEHEIAALLINKKSHIEKSLYWIDRDTGVLCKARPDIISKNILIDLKSSKDLAYRSFRYGIKEYGYHIQAAMIQDGWATLTGNKIEMSISLACEKEEPWLPIIYQLNPDDIELGREMYKDALVYFKKCRDTDTWPGYKSKIISIPRY